jgi:hypothetical protein
LRYTIKRISLGSALRVGLALGWLIALFPSLTLAWLALAALRRINEALGQVAPYELSVLGQTIARLDLLQMLGLTELVQSVARLAGGGWATFFTLAAILTLAGAAIVVVTLLAFCLCYNLLAAAIGGIALELEAA